MPTHTLARFAIVRHLSHPLSNVPLARARANQAILLRPQQLYCLSGTSTVFEPVDGPSAGVDSVVRRGVEALEHVRRPNGAVQSAILAAGLCAVAATLVLLIELAAWRDARLAISGGPLLLGIVAASAWRQSERRRYLQDLASALERADGYWLLHSRPRGCLADEVYVEYVPISFAESMQLFAGGLAAAALVVSSLVEAALAPIPPFPTAFPGGVPDGRAQTASPSVEAARRV
jgi:hypothetical protein